jgi:carbamoyl-phosphate synthase small subunit
LTDPSFAGQIITFTFPHVGNVGANAEDIESASPSVRGAIFRADVTSPSNWRATKALDAWLASHNIPAISGIDTRALTRRIRDIGAPNGVIVHAPDEKFDLEALVGQAAAWPGLEGMDLAKEVSCTQQYGWDETLWRLGSGYGRLGVGALHVVAVDYGAKRNILRCLANSGCRVTVVPADTSFAQIMAHRPDGVFLAMVPAIRRRPASMPSR